MQAWPERATERRWTYQSSRSIRPTWRDRVDGGSSSGAAEKQLEDERTKTRMRYAPTNIKERERGDNVSTDVTIDRGGRRRRGKVVVELSVMVVVADRRSQPNHRVMFTWDKQRRGLVP